MVYDRNTDFALEYRDSLYEASERIRNLLRIKYQGDEYVADTTRGSNSDSKMQAIITKVQTGTKLIYASELAFTSMTDSQIEKSDEDLKKEQQKEEKKRIAEEKRRLAEEKRIEAEKNKGLTARQKAQLKAQEEKLKNSKMPPDYDDDDEDYDNDNDVDEMTQNVVQEPERKTNYIRSVPAYVDLANNFKSLEMLLKGIIHDVELLLPDVGYCEPATIASFYDVCNDFNATNDSLRARLYNKNNKLVAKNTTLGANLPRIYVSYNKLSEMIAEFGKAINRVRETYNYTQSAENANRHNDTEYSDVSISQTEKAEISGGSYLSRIRNMH